MAEEKKNKKTNWKTTDNRFVAFLDLLGFKDKVMRKTHSDIYDELSNISASKKKLEELSPITNEGHYFADSDIYIVSFSDSVVLFSKNDSYINFEYFLVSLRFLFSNAIRSNIAIKGGIAHGEISLNKSEQIYFGQPIIDAYLIEEDVNYLGVSCHNSIDSYLEKNKQQAENSNLIEGLLFSSVTPLKCGKIFHRNLDYFVMIPNERDKEATEIEEEVLSKLKSYYQTVSGSARRYIDNTIDLYEKLVKENKTNFKGLKA
ncbi:hypothetical protein DI383_14620 [Flavobacteriaceae bacterium LYZ1037]|nr:hypothetical protein DI383_14620 [Flavobacteriaceae bacterium LYZ1037]